MMGLTIGSWIPPFQLQGLSVSQGREDRASLLRMLHAAHGLEGWGARTSVPGRVPPLRSCQARGRASVSPSPAWEPCPATGLLGDSGAEMPESTERGASQGESAASTGLLVGLTSSTFSFNPACSLVTCYLPLHTALDCRSSRQSPTPTALPPHIPAPLTQP